MRKDFGGIEEKMKIGGTAGAAYLLLFRHFYHESPLLSL